MEVLDDRLKPTVSVKWDSMPDVAGGDEYTESEQVCCHLSGTKIVISHGEWMFLWM